MSAFVVAAIGMLAAAIPCLVVVWRGSPMEAVVAYEAIGSIVVMTLILLAEWFRRSGEFAPYFFDVPVHTPAVDPVVQALALTDVVVEAAVTALLLAFAIQAHKRFGTLDPHELVQLKG